MEESQDVSRHQLLGITSQNSLLVQHQIANTAQGSLMPKEQLGSPIATCNQGAGAAIVYGPNAFEGIFQVAYVKSRFSLDSVHNTW